MKKTLLNNLKFIVLGLVLSFGIGAYATGTWNAPTASAPSGGIDVPLHTGPDQIKTTGSCTSGNCGGLSVGPFAVFSNTEFDQTAYFNGMIRGGNSSTANSQVTFGDSSHTVNGDVAGNVSAVGALQDGGVANSDNSTLCAATDGTISVCGAPAPTEEIYTVPAQQVAWPMPDYAYDGNPQHAYVEAVCLSGPALRAFKLKITYTSAQGTQGSAALTINPGQSCASNAPTSVVLSAPATKVGQPQSQCIYDTSDPTYQAQPYQGYAVDVDPSLQCPH